MRNHTAVPGPTWIGVASKHALAMSKHARENAWEHAWARLSTPKQGSLTATQTISSKSAALHTKLPHTVCNNVHPSWPVSCWASPPRDTLLCTHWSGLLGNPRWLEESARDRCYDNWQAHQHVCGIVVVIGPTKDCSFKGPTTDCSFIKSVKQHLIMNIVIEAQKTCIIYNVPEDATVSKLCSKPRIPK